MIKIILKVALIFSFLVLISRFSFAQEIDSSYLQLVIKSTQEKIDIVPSAELYKVRGWAYFLLDKKLEALDDYNSAIKLDPNDHELYFRRGEIYYELERYTESVINYNKAIVLALDKPEYYLARGLAHEKIDKFDLALKDYSKAIEIDQDYLQALVNRAILYSDELNNLSRSIDDWNKIVLLDPSSNNLFDRGYTYMEFGEYEESIRDFGLCIELNNHSIECYILRGYAYGLLNDYKKSQSDFDTAIAIDSENGNIYLYRGKIFKKFGFLDKACEDFKKAIQFGIDNNLAHPCN